MRYDPAPADLFARNREKLAGLLKPNSLVVVHANDVMPTNGDGVMPFKQNTDLYYLSGIDQEETVLILYPDAQDEADRAILYTRETNEHIRIWEGEKLSRDLASELSGIKTCKWTGAFEADFARLAVQAAQLYLPTNEHTRAGNTIATRNDRFIRECQERFPLHGYERLAPLMAQLRAVKEPEEIAMIGEALAITESALRRVLDKLRPGIGEWQIEAELAHEFLRRRSRGFAFPPIVASGASTCCLHYLENDQICEDGDLVLIDVGAEWGYWNADITRTFPVNGRFTERQRAVYEAVLRIQRHAMSLLKPGVSVKEYDYAVKGFAGEELVKLGLLSTEELSARSKEKDPVRKYFMHGTSHSLGLDVHDVAPPNTVIAEGMLFTVEPGIYIPDEGLGIRLENNVLVTAKGIEDLSASIPLEPDDIEALMAKQS